MILKKLIEGKIIVKLYQISERSMRKSLQQIKEAGLKYALLDSLTLLRKFLQKDAFTKCCSFVKSPTLLILDWQEKDGNKDLSVPGAGVCFTFSLMAVRFVLCYDAIWIVLWVESQYQEKNNAYIHISYICSLCLSHLHNLLHLGWLENNGTFTDFEFELLALTDLLTLKQWCNHSNHESCDILLHRLF